MGLHSFDDLASRCKYNIARPRRTLTTIIFRGRARSFQGRIIPSVDFRRTTKSKNLKHIKHLFLLGYSYYTLFYSICQEQNQKSTSSNLTRSGIIRMARQFHEPSFYADPNSEFTKKKLDYISRRLGHIFTLRDAAMFKIVINLKEFLTANGITQYTRYPDIIDQLDKFFIGFLSMDNCYITLRRQVPEGKVSKYIDTRFVNYDIFGINQNSMRYYVIPNYIDLNKPLEIHIAEGAFDIISIYNHVAPIGTNGIFAAVLGKSYVSLVRFFIINYGFTSFDLHIYADNDVDTADLMRIKNDIYPFNIRMIIHRNTFPGEKDFGVLMDHIHDSTKII